MKTLPVKFTLGLTAAVILLGSPQASAQTWDGGGGDNDWTTDDNWVGNVAPVANASLIFAGSTRTNAVNDFAADTIFNLIRFDGAASAFTLSGNRIGLGIANDASGNIRWDGSPGVITQTISADLNLSVGGAGTRSFNVAPNATLELSGTISGSGAWSKLGLGTLALTGSNSVGGIVFLQTGTVQISSLGNAGVNSALGAGDSFRVGTAANTATISLAGSSSAQSSNRQVIVGTGGTVGSTGGATIRNDNVNASNSLTFSNATFNVAQGIGNANATRTITLGGTNTGNNTIEGGIINNNGTTGVIGLTKADAGTWILTGNSSYTGATTVSGGTLELARVGGPSLGSTTSLSISTGGTLRLMTSDQLNDAATVTLAGGTIQNTNAGGVSETFGNLNLTADSFIDFGNGLGLTNTLNFGTYMGGGFKLNVADFAEGNVLSFETDLTSSINNPSLFGFDNAFTSAWDGSTFTITAVPEPSTLMALGLAGLISLVLGRRRFLRD